MPATKPAAPANDPFEHAPVVVEVAGVPGIIAEPDVAPPTAAQPVPATTPTYPSEPAPTPATEEPAPVRMLMAATAEEPADEPGQVSTGVIA